MKRTTKMAVVEIDHRIYLLPAAAALRIVEALGDAVEVDERYGEDGYEYVLRERAPSVTYKLVRAPQLRARPRPERERQPELRLLPAPGKPCIGGGR